MSTEARVTPMPGGPAIEHKRRGRKAADAKEKTGSTVLFYLGEGGGQEGDRVVLKEECPSEGDALVQSLKRDAPYYRVEIWRARAVVKEGSVEIKKEQISVRA